MAHGGKRPRAGRKSGLGGPPLSHLWRIYVVQEDGTENVCKIGISCKDVRIRLGALQNGNWRRLRVALSAIVPTEDIAEQLEQRVHFKIRHLRIISEWFRVDLATAQSMIAEAMLEMAVSNEPEQQELI